MDKITSFKEWLQFASVIEIHVNIEVKAKTNLLFIKIVKNRLQGFVYTLKPFIFRVNIVYRYYRHKFTVCTSI